MKARSFCRIILVLVFVSLMSTPASSQPFSIHTPTNWVPMFPPDYTVRLIQGTPDKSKLIVVSIYPIDGPLPESTLGGDRKQTHHAALAQIAAGGPPTYTSTAIEIVDDKQWRRVKHLFITNNTVYRVDAIQDRADPMKDPEIAASVRSFCLQFMGSDGVWPFGPRPLQLQAKQAKELKGLTPDQLGNVIWNITLLLMVLMAIGWVLLKVVRDVTTAATTPVPPKRPTTPPPLPGRLAQPPPLFQSRS